MGVFADQQRHFDEEMTNFRRFYESNSPEDRVKIRAWLERVEAVAKEGDDFGMFLRVRTEFTEFDNQGKEKEWVDSQFSPHTLLEAIKAWDAGEAFTPLGPLP